MGILPAEQIVLNALNIEPSNVSRNTTRLFDIKFNYMARHHAPRADELNGHCSYLVGERRDWMPLVVLRTIHDSHHCEALCKIAFGSPLPEYAGDWSVFRDLDHHVVWMLFERAVNTFMRTMQDAMRFAQPKE